MPAAAGLIIAAAVLIAAGVAAYENEQVREWIDTQRRKIVMAMNGRQENEYDGRRRYSRDDPSVHEEMTELAAERRRQARQDILERGQRMEEARSRRRNQGSSASASTSFDTLVDRDGALRPSHDKHEIGMSSSTAIDQAVGQAEARRRAFPSAETEEQPREIQAAPSETSESYVMPPQDPFESRYEQEMRRTFNLPVPVATTMAPSTHESESLIDFTPTSEFPPDPDFSVPSETPSNQHDNPFDQSEYHSAAGSNPVQSQTLSPESRSEIASDGVSQVLPSRSLHASAMLSNPGSDAARQDVPVSERSSAVPSVVSSIHHIHASDAADSEVDMMSEAGDGIMTPASWTDIESNVSGDNDR